MEVSNGIIKWVHSLAQKKNRDRERCFVAEGTKCVLDTLGAFRLRGLFCTENWLRAHNVERASVVSSVQIERMSMLKTPTEVIAVYEMPDYGAGLSEAVNNLNLALDGVQDPGNLGTIIRIADWFGIRDVYCSMNTVDVYNPKVVQATMGAISRVRTHYCDLPGLFHSLKDVPVFGTFLNGCNMYEEELDSKGFIVMGNEGNGISPEVERYVTKRVHIPSYPAGGLTSESLNVGMATAIVVSEFRRRMI